MHLELCGHRSEARVEEAIVFREGGGSGDRVIGFGRGMHQCEDALGESLGDSALDK